MYAQYKKRTATKTNTPGAGNRTGYRPQGRTKVTGTGQASVHLRTEEENAKRKRSYVITSTRPHFFEGFKPPTKPGATSSHKLRRGNSR